MDPDKVKAIQDQEVPTIVKGIRGFLGFMNFYRHFIQQYSEIVLPLTALTKKDYPFIQSTKADEVFRHLKRIFLTEPTLA